MAEIRLGSLAIDCPDPSALATFYSTLLGFEMNGDDAILTPEGWEIWFQEVEDYQAPTWPTQERGQQLHFDVATNDIGAAVVLAESVGAKRAPNQGNHEWVVMLDPAGHPFCFVQHRAEVDGDRRPTLEGVPSIVFRGPFIDCPDHQSLATFYIGLLGGQVIMELHDGYVVIVTETGRHLAFQHVEGYQAPTWPTQERGQQMHFDMEVDDMETAQSQALSYGARLVDDEQDSFHVFLDPAGHPFCLCVNRVGES